MNTENLLAYNPKLAEVTHPTRVAYAKFMNAKIKKELRFNDDVSPTKEKTNINSVQNSIKKPLPLAAIEQTIGILKQASLEKEDEKKKVEPSEEPKDEEKTNGSFKDFRSRTPIDEEDEVTSPGTTTPDNMLSPERVKSPKSPIPPSSPTTTNAEVAPDPSPSSSPLPSIPDPPTSPKTNSSIAKKSDSEESDDAEIQPVNPNLLSPRPQSGKLSPVPEHPSPSFNMSSDKGKSKISGKTLTGWL
jgi:transient receptor potential cation channel subfamily C protein 4